VVNAVIVLSIHKTRAEILIIVLALIFKIECIFAQPLRIEFASTFENPEFGKVWITGFEEIPISSLEQISQQEWKSIFSVYTGEYDSGNIPSVLGNYQVIETAIVFMPRFPPTPGLSYTILFDSQLLWHKLGLKSTDSLLVRKVVKVPTIDYKPTKLDFINPQTDSIPANILSMYLHFSSPMSFENPYVHVKLYNDKDELINQPFVEVNEGLWDPERKRLTLFFHPGRIKRGVGPNMTMGPIFEPDHHYTMVVSENWKDAHGNSLGIDYEKSLYILPADRNQVDPFQWNLTQVTAGTLDKLTVSFGEVLDPGLVSRMITLVLENGTPVPGKSSPTVSQDAWQFIPETHWKRGDYLIMVDAKLEDLAGNSVRQIFEKKIEKNTLPESINYFIYLSLTVQ